jgi:transposase-like protein
MGEVRRASATTIFAVRATLQRSQASLAQLCVALGITPKAVAEWRKRVTAEDLKTRPKEPRSTVLTKAENAAVVTVRRHTLLSPDDYLHALQPTIAQLTRLALHRRLQWHGISRLTDVAWGNLGRQKFSAIRLGYFLLISQTCRRPRASSVSSSKSTAHANLPCPNALKD